MTPPHESAEDLEQIQMQAISPNLRALIWILGAVVLALLSGGVGFAVNQASAESRYATKADLDRITHTIDKQITVSDQQARTINAIIVALQSHLAVDDHRYRAATPPAIGADVIPRGD